VTITYQQEFMATVAPDMQVLLEQHWQEIALNQDKIKLNPDWEAYADLDAAGVAKAFTARCDGILVGYFVVFCKKNIHYKDHIFAVNDVIYLHPDYRRGMVGIKLIKFAEKCLADDGVSVLVVNTKTHRPFDAVLERLKFGLTERVYTKYIGGD
jgi:GNAT superfamily N-acetyltransferase